MRFELPGDNQYFRSGFGHDSGFERHPQLVRVVTRSRHLDFNQLFLIIAIIEYLVVQHFLNRPLTESTIGVCQLDSKWHRT